MKEYIIHGTTSENLENILKSKYIEANINKKGQGVLDNSQAVNQIFTQLLYRNLPNENIQIPHWSKCCLVLDKKILKDYPFYATVIGGFYNKFSDAFVKNETLVKSKGNLTKMPNLKKLKEHIITIMKNNQNISFIHSHEILFSKRISLKKYCKLILYCDNIIPENIILLASQLNIPIKQYGYINKKFVGNGLNNFIDIIEK